MNRSARRAALGMAVAAKAADGSISVIDAAGFKPAKTKDFVAFLERSNTAAMERSDSSDRAKGKGKVLFLIDREKDEHADAIALAGRNLRGLTIAPVAGVSAHALLAHDRVIFTKNAYEALAEVCSA